MQLILVPERVRRRAAAPLIRKATEDGHLADVIALERAVSFPSGRGYLLPADAVARVLGDRW